MMDPASEALLFEPLLCQNSIHDQFERPFTPVAHDLIVLSPDGVLQIAKNASARQIVQFLACSKSKCAAFHDEEKDDTAALIVIRFEEDDPKHEAPSRSIDDWSQLWPSFDSCCNNDDNVIDFVTRLRQADSHCYSSISENTKSDGLHVIECSKIFYSISFLDKHMLLAHHFHKINGEFKDMVRIVTCGISEEKIEAVLRKALLFLNIRSSESDNGSLGSAVSLTPIPHPKAIICGMLECLEEVCRKQLEIDRNYIVKIETDINRQRDPSTRKPKGLEINYVKLSETSIRLGEVRQKLQCLLSSIASLESTRGLPSCYKPSPTMRDKQSTGSGSPDTLEGRFYKRQLREVKLRLMGLKGKSQQHKINIENLQERVKGILSIVSILLAEKENEWSHQALEKRQQTSDYQIEMLKQQELIASRTKRDNTVMKVIAVLTALFLPGTFIATVFSVPIFNWGEDEIIGPHFMTYWYFTAPITTILVVGFSAWFVKMWYDDKQAKKIREKEESQEDPERVGGARKGKASSES